MNSTQAALAHCGIHQHWNPALAEVNIVLTEPGQPAPSPDTEITLQHHVFVPGRILEEVVIIREDDGEDSVWFVQDHPSTLQLAAFIQDRIIERQ